MANTFSRNFALSAAFSVAMTGMALAQDADAQDDITCGQRTEMLTSLYEGGQKHVAFGQTFTGPYMEYLANEETAESTILLSFPQGVSCEVFDGIHYSRDPKEPVALDFMPGGIPVFYTPDELPRGHVIQIDHHEGNIDPEQGPVEFYQPYVDLVAHLEGDHQEFLMTETRVEGTEGVLSLHADTLSEERAQRTWALVFREAVHGNAPATVMHVRIPFEELGIELPEDVEIDVDAMPIRLSGFLYTDDADSMAGLAPSAAP